MVAKVVASGSPNEGMRPFEMHRDLLQLANLIELAFQPELDETRNPIAAEMRRLANAGPLLWLLDASYPALSSLMGGYVWIAGGQLVGNVTLGLESRRHGLWSISNVAVHPDFRARGIAHQLMKATLREAHNQGAQLIVLEVQTDNIPAQRLYHELGFQVYDTIAELSLPEQKWKGRTALPSLVLRKRRPDDWRGLYNLLKTVTPAKAQEIKPILPCYYYLGVERRFERWLDGLLSRRRSSDWVLEEDDRIVALLELTGQCTQAAHRLQITVHPDNRGTIEEELLAAGLDKLNRFPVREVVSRVSMSHPEAQQAFHQAGFHAIRVLDQMYLDLRHRGEKHA